MDVLFKKGIWVNLIIQFFDKTDFWVVLSGEFYQNNLWIEKKNPFKRLKDI